MCSSCYCSGPQVWLGGQCNRSQPLLCLCLRWLLWHFPNRHFSLTAGDWARPRLWLTAEIFTLAYNHHSAVCRGRHAGQPLLYNNNQCQVYEEHYLRANNIICYSMRTLLWYLYPVSIIHEYKLLPLPLHRRTEPRVISGVNFFANSSLIKIIDWSGTADNNNTKSNFSLLLSPPVITCSRFICLVHKKTLLFDF